MAAQKIIVIDASRGNESYWSDAWAARDLIFFIAMRDAAVRYKQNFAGVAWVVIRPALGIILLTVIFGAVASLPSGGVPYAIMVATGMLPWQLFASGFAESSHSVVANSHLISKIYFPRIILPASAILASAGDFVISLAVLIVICAVFGFPPGIRILMLPLYAGLASLTAAAVGLWVAAFNVRFRDVRHVLPFAIQFGLYLSPVGFSSEVVPAKWQMIYSLNPMVAVIDGFRWAMLGAGPEPLTNGLWPSMVFTLALFAGGLWYFQRCDKNFCDMI